MLACMSARAPAFAWLDSGLKFVGECTFLLGYVARRVFRPPFEHRELLQQMSFIGASSVPIVVLTTFSSGAVIALYLAKTLVQYGASSLAGAAVGLSVVRELAPVLVGIMVAARCGSAMSAQIGTMAVTEQIDALRSLNVHPVNYLVIPRLFASVVMVPALGLIGMYSGVLGGYFVSVVVQGISDGTFWSSFRQFVDVPDFAKGVAKTVVFGLIVAVVACQQGLATEGGAVGVGKTTTRTVVVSMVLIYVADYFLTQAMFA